MKSVFSDELQCEKWPLNIIKIRHSMKLIAGGKKCQPPTQSIESARNRCRIISAQCAIVWRKNFGPAVSFNFR